jgi:hypothetical protein
MSAIREFASAPYEVAGPGILALQDVGDFESRPIWEDWPPVYQHLEARLNALRSWRYSWWQHWAILAQYILPYRWHWWVTANTYNRGFPVNESIINETATLAMEVCAAGLLSGLMSPSRPWFRLDPALTSFEPDAQGRYWLDDTAERILAVMSGSNWYLEGAQMFKDVATFGTSPLIIYEDYEDVIRCYNPCAGEYFLQVGSRLSVDVLDREFTYTVGQIVEFFRIENCPSEVKNAWEEGGGSVDREFVVAHAIEPNFPIRARDGRQIRPVPSHFTWREVYWLRGRSTEAPLSMRGFTERPFMATRWSKTSNDAYGRGPGMDALPGTRQLQQEESRKGEYIDKMVRPPMGADVSLERKPASILPGDITYYDASEGKRMIHPLFEVNGQGMQPMTEDIERVEARIKRAFKEDIFMIISQMEGIQPKNEFELAQRVGEKIQVLGPVIELFEQEVAGGIQRVVSIMQRRGLLKPMPASLRGVPIKLTYTSIMKQAQRQAQLAAMERALSLTGKLAEAAQVAGVPQPLRIINLDETMRDYCDLSGFPAKDIYTKDQVAQMDEAKAHQAALSQAAQLAQPAVQAAQGLAAIPPDGGNSALGQIIGSQQQ